jgi:hypothetical protein
MAKFFGKIGFESTVEERPGIWVPGIVERDYYGDVTRNTRRLESTDKVNDDITINNEISIVSDPFANENFYSMRYVEYAGSKWRVTNVEVQYPRLILTVGGLYNGN